MADFPASQVADDSSSPSGPDPRRRSLLGMLAAGGWVLGLAALGLTGGLWAAATARFLYPNVVPRRSDRFKVGPPNAYPAGRVETKFQPRFGVCVVHGCYQGQPQLFALRTVCTHLGCVTRWYEAEERFRCPCHGSGFSRDGVNQEGPAPRPLERVAIHLADDGQLEIDAGQVFQEELGQWRDPRSFVPV